MDGLNRRDFLALGAGGLAALGARRDDGGLVVHEWGVVTIPYGAKESGVRSAGVRLGKRGEEIADLPKFVATWAGAVGKQIAELEAMPVRKPVVYFYSKAEARVRLKVSIPGGRPDAWWPPADDFAPKAKFLNPRQLGGRPQKLSEIEPKDGHLAWQTLTVDPAAGEFPKADGWWETARKTDAATVRHKGAVEKFLFYDALTLCDPGLSILWKKGGKVELHNGSEEPLRHLFALRVKDGRCSSAYHRELEKGGRVELAVAEGEPGNFADGLVDAGLYRKEAAAIVEIWKEEFFRIDGARVLTILPRAAYDRLLPLEIHPAPKELQRVLIAHLECLDAEAREAIASLVEQLGADELEKREAAATTLRARMPLAGSVIREALRAAKDAEIRGRLEDLLKPLNK